MNRATEAVQRARAQKRQRHTEPHAEAHWQCPDCGLPCYCTGDARLTKHTRCRAGKPPLLPSEAIDDAMRRAYEDWQRSGRTPGGHRE